MGNENSSTLTKGTTIAAHHQQQQASFKGMYNRSPAGLPASAIVQPFNYSPPVQQAFVDANQPMENLQQQKQQPKQQDFKAPAPPSGLPRKTSLNAAVRRNDSYVSSMGRKQDDSKIAATESSNLMAERDKIPSPIKNNTVTDSGSTLVTLV